MTDLEIKLYQDYINICVYNRSKLEYIKIIDHRNCNCGEAQNFFVGNLSHKNVTYEYKGKLIDMCINPFQFYGWASKRRDNRINQILK